MAAVGREQSSHYRRALTARSGYAGKSQIAVVRAFRERAVVVGCPHELQQMSPST